MDLAAGFNSASDLAKLGQYRIQAVVAIKGAQEATGTLTIYQGQENGRRQDIEFTDYGQIEVTRGTLYYVWRKPDLVLEFIDLLAGVDGLWKVSMQHDVQPSSVSRADVHGRDALCFSLHPDKGTEVRNCFDAVNHFLISRQIRSGWSSQEILFLDYQEMDGIHFPASIRILRPHAPEIDVEKISLIKMQLDPVVFVPPAGARQFSVCQGGKPAQLVHRAEPAYPQMARIAHIMGEVRMLATIGTDGKLHDLHAFTGHPLLLQSALDAVKQWTYVPEMCPSGAVATETTIRISFKM